jgi:DNA processing protein
MTPPHAFIAALAGFRRMTTARLAALVAHRTAEDAYAIAVGDRPPPPTIAALFDREPGLAAAWRENGRVHGPELVWQRCTEGGIDVVVPGDADYPAQLLDDPRRPEVLFVRGDLAALDARRVGLVGTRNATQRGRQTAAQLGHELAAAGVTVLSGLARGIDGAAHRGVLAVPGARPVAIVGNGVDRPYPRQHESLWNDVARAGAVISEWPPGTPPDAFRSRSEIGFSLRSSKSSSSSRVGSAVAA